MNYSYTLQGLGISWVSQKANLEAPKKQMSILGFLTQVITFNKQWPPISLLLVLQEFDQNLIASVMKGSALHPVNGRANAMVPTLPATSEVFFSAILSLGISLGPNAN